ncbi:hypothetical protein ACG2LH_06490 [Zhouia sp. PK063]|uniref:hypothetical protein n=1 Tax=Zhouia sp. PK063 TaxID=3373602 RepID=UPI00379CF62C
MKVKLFNFNKRENKRFNYTPRYYEGKSITNIYDFDSSKFVKYRETPSTRDFGAQWKSDRTANRHRGNREINKRFIIIFLILLLIALYFFDFDLSIFTFTRR